MTLAINAKRCKIITLLFICVVTDLPANAKKIETEILINATPQHIWLILTDFEHYRDWNPFVKSIAGTPDVGSKITVNANGMTFRPRVVVFDGDHTFSWKGKFLFGGLFDGLHTFELINNGDGTTTFRQCENFSGILVGFFKKRLDTGTRSGFESMNKKLKELAEQQ